MESSPDGDMNAVSKNKILFRRVSLGASITILDYKIQTLCPYFSDVEVNHWIDRRHELARQLAALPTEQQIQANAKRINYSNSTKFWK